MATLLEINDEIKAPLSIIYKLNSLETFSDGSSEGWLAFEIKLLRGDDVLISNEGTIQDIDARAIEDICLNVTDKRNEYQPLEPDFIISTEKYSDDEAGLMCLVDTGSSEKRAYSGSEIGVNIPTTILALRKFGEELKAERIAITDDKTWEI